MGHLVPLRSKGHSRVIAAGLSITSTHRGICVRLVKLRVVQNVCWICSSMLVAPNLNASMVMPYMSIRRNRVGTCSADVVKICCRMRVAGDAKHANHMPCATDAAAKCSTNHIRRR